MALATKTPSFLNQIDSVIAQNEKPIEKSKTEVEAKERKSSKPKEPKRDNSDALMLRLPKGERQAFKVFCAEKGTDMTSFIYACMDFVRFGTEEGYLQVSKGGVKLLKSKIME